MRGNVFMFNRSYLSMDENRSVKTFKEKEIALYLESIVDKEKENLNCYVFLHDACLYKIFSEFIDVVKI